MVPPPKKKSTCEWVETTRETTNRGKESRQKTGERKGKPKQKNGLMEKRNTDQIHL